MGHVPISLLGTVMVMKDQLDSWVADGSGETAQGVRRRSSCASVRFILVGRTVKKSVSHILTTLFATLSHWSECVINST